MKTQADEARESAITNVQSAIENLAEIVVNQCHGHDEFNDAFKQTLALSLQGLIEIREALTPH